MEVEEEDTGGYLIVKLTLHSCPSIATLSIHVKCCSYHQREREGTLKKKAKYPKRKEKEGDLWSHKFHFPHVQLHNTNKSC